MIFFFEFVYIVDYIHGFSYMQPWDETYLIVVNDGFDVFLDSIFKNFILYFCIDIHKQDWPEVLFSVGALCGLGIRVIVAS